MRRLQPASSRRIAAGESNVAWCFAAYAHVCTSSNTPPGVSQEASDLSMAFKEAAREASMAWCFAAYAELCQELQSSSRSMSLPQLHVPDIVHQFDEQIHFQCPAIHGELCNNLASELSLQIRAEVVDVILGLESQQEKQMLHGALQPMHTCTQPVTLRLVLLSLGARRNLKILNLLYATVSGSTPF